IRDRNVTGVQTCALPISIAGTTRDAIDTVYNYEDQEYVLIDTAGMRKKGKVYESTEKYSVLRALKAIERSNVVLVVIDAEEGIIEQDKKVADRKSTRLNS